MRNRYPGICYRCGQSVAAGDGHFERHSGGWRTQHATCAVTHRRDRIATPKDETPNTKDSSHG